MQCVLQSWSDTDTTFNASHTLNRTILLDTQAWIQIHTQKNVARVNFGALKDVHANFGKNIKFVVGGNLQHFNLFLFHNWSKLSILSICPKTNILHEPKIPKYYFWYKCTKIEKLFETLQRSFFSFRLISTLLLWLIKLSRVICALVH